MYLKKNYQIFLAEFYLLIRFLLERFLDKLEFPLKNLWVVVERSWILRELFLDLFLGVLRNFWLRKKGV
jgi:hypothetical protein